MVLGYSDRHAWVGAFEEENVQWHTSMLSYWGGMSLGPGPGLDSDESDIGTGEHESVFCPQLESCPLIQSC